MNWRLAHTLTFATISLSAAPALALEAGQCLPAAAVRTALASEKQNPIIVGNRSGYGNPTSLIFTANVDGTKGYAILGDKPFGEQASEVCVQSVYRDIRLNDNTKPGVPAWANSKVDRTTAGSICKRDKLGYQEQCLPHDQSLANLEKGGVRVMLRATGSAINPRDKSVRQNQNLIVAVRSDDGKGIINAVTGEGASYVLSAYTGASFTQSAKPLLLRH